MTLSESLGAANERRERLLELLRSEPNEAECQSCLRHLGDYVAAQLAGQDYVARFPDMAAHLDACPDCADAYGRLYELELAVAADRLPRPDHLPGPDLSFLSLEDTGALAPGTLQQRLQTALRRVGDKLVLQLSTDLLLLLQPPAASAQVRGPADGERYREMLWRLEPDPDLRPEYPLTVRVYRDAQQPAVCLMEVTVEPPEKSWPDLEGVAVALNLADERRSQVTDAWGLVAFDDVPIANLPGATLEIEL